MIVKRGSGSDSTWTFAASARDPSLRELTVSVMQSWGQGFFSDIYCSQSLATVALWKPQYRGFIAAVGKEPTQNRRDINMCIQYVNGEIVQRKTPLESSRTKSRAVHVAGYQKREWGKGKLSHAPRLESRKGSSINFWELEKKYSWCFVIKSLAKNILKKSWVWLHP